MLRDYRLAVSDGIVELLMNRSGVSMQYQCIIMLRWRDRVPYCKTAATPLLIHYQPDAHDAREPLPTLSLDGTTAAGGRGQHWARRENTGQRYRPLLAYRFEPWYGDG
jgi:hypothetical protein